MNDTPAILAVGAGLVGSKHANIIAERARLAGIVDPGDGAEALAAELGAPWFRDIEQALSATRPDGAVIATPNQLHVAHGTACVAARVPMLIEKPIADRSDQAAKLVAAARVAGVPVLVGHHRRHNPLIAAAKAAIDAGRLGRLIAVTGQFWLVKPDDYFAPAWRRQTGAGPVFINLIHDIDLIRHFVGEVRAIQAVDSSAARGFEVEDTAAVLMEFANGALGTVSISDTISAPWSWEFTAGENPAYPHVPGTCYTIGGTHGALSVPDMKLWHHPGARSWWAPIAHDILSAPEMDPLHRQIDHFCDVIRGTAEPLVSGEEGLRTLRVIEAIKTAAATGTRVVLEDDE